MDICRKVGAGIARMGMAVALALAPLAVTGCSTHLDKSYTFTVSTGDSVKVTVDMKAGYELSQQNGTFAVTKDDRTLVTGMFAGVEEFDSYKEAMESGTFDGDIETNTDDLLAWSYSDEDGEEHDRCVRVSDRTSVLMNSMVGKDEAEGAYEAISFEAEDE